MSPIKIFVFQKIKLKLKKMYFITQSFDNLIRVKFNFTSQHFSIEFHALFTVKTLFKLLIQKYNKPAGKRDGGRLISQRGRSLSCRKLCPFIDLVSEAAFHSTLAASKKEQKGKESEKF